MAKPLIRVYILLFVALVMNIAMWLHTNRKMARWPNMPMVTNDHSVSMSFLGDRTLAYRVWALALQNIGNTGGNVQALKNYDYKALYGWFNLLDRFDQTSNYVPMLAAFYFGGTQNPQEQLPYVTSYLEMVGSRTEPQEKWRWLSQAIYLTRHKLKDIPEALRLSKKLAEMYNPDTMPAWTLQTPALITAEMGDKKAAYLMLKAMITTESEKMDPNEVYFMVDYICVEILTPEEVKAEPMCGVIPRAMQRIQQP